MVMQCNTYAVLYIIIVVFYFEISSNGYELLLFFFKKTVFVDSMCITAVL